MKNINLSFKRLLLSFSFFLPITFLLSQQVFAQGLTETKNDAEVFVSGGQLFFLGDLGGGKGIGTKLVKDVNLPVTSFNISAGLKYYISDAITARFTFTKGTLEGADSLITNKGGDEADRKARNLSFKSPLTEFIVGADIFPLALFDRQNVLRFPHSIYLTTGAGVMFFNPKAKDIDGSWVALHPLHLEGQGMAEYSDRKNYSLVQPVVILGAGARLKVSQRAYLGVELVHRFLFTDYIDDVSTSYIDPALFDKYLSPQNAAIAKRLAYRANEIDASAASHYNGNQRGNPKNTDAYFTFNISLSYTLLSKHNPDKIAWTQSKCPALY